MPANANTEQTADAVAAAEERLTADTQDQGRVEPRNESRSKDEGRRTAHKKEQEEEKAEAAVEKCFAEEDRAQNRSWNIKFGEGQWEQPTPTTLYR